MLYSQCTYVKSNITEMPVFSHHIQGAQGVHVQIFVCELQSDDAHLIFVHIDHIGTIILNV